MLSDRCPVCPVSNGGVPVLWPNGWMGQDQTWHTGRPRPWPHCVRWGPSSPSSKGAQPPIYGPCLLRPNGCMDQDVTWYAGRPRPRRLPKFSANLYCGKTARYIKIPHGMEIGLSPADFVRSTKKGAETPNFRPMSIAAKGLHGSRRHYVRR